MKWVLSSRQTPEPLKRVLCQTVTKKGIRNWIVGYHDGSGWCCGMNSNVEAWMAIEPYEPNEKRGWERASSYTVSCPHCGKEFWETVKSYNYCPNCGADMRGDQDG